MESISDTEGISNSVFKTQSINIGALYVYVVLSLVPIEILLFVPFVFVWLNGGISQSRSVSVTDTFSKSIGYDLKSVVSVGLSVALSAVGGAVGLTFVDSFNCLLNLH